MNCYTKHFISTEELEVSRFEAEVLVATDYYPFGMIMPERDWTYKECTLHVPFAF